MSDVLTSLEGQGQRILPVFITIDPERDDGPRLKRYFKDAGLHPRFVGLTGSADQLRAACRKYRVYYTRPTPEERQAGDYLIDHSIISYLVSPDGVSSPRGTNSINSRIDPTEAPLSCLQAIRTPAWA